jgi:hypothetical protein
MDTPAPRKYNQQRYWRYVFTPLLLVIIAFGLYILFTMPDTQSLSYTQVTSRINSLRKGASNTASSAFSSPGSVGSV